MIPKFRAWDKDKKWMVYDVQDAYDGLWSERNSDEINDYYSYVCTFQSFTDEERFNFMQYTGLNDKNGKEIYEGDIVKDSNSRVAYVTFLQQEMGYVLVYHNNDTRLLGHRNTGSSYDIDFNIEVIGNIYENTELLEG